MSLSGPSGVADQLRRRAQAMRDGTESGFAMIYVLMVSAIITVLTGTTLVAASGNIVPAIRNAYNQAAYAAAQGGLQSFVAYADAKCTEANSSVATCTLPTNYSGVVPIYSSGGYTATYAWLATKDPSNRYFRVRATGEITQGGITTQKTLIADVAGGASNNLLDYGVVTGFETESPLVVLANFFQRTIALNPTAITNAGVPIKNGKIMWSGASPGTAAGKIATCNSLYTGTQGRVNNQPPGAPNPYVDWSEDGLQGNKYTNYQPCQVSMGHSTKLLEPDNPADGAGGYYTDDALLVSNSFPGGTGPLFNQPVTTKYQYTPADGPCGKAGQNYRSLNLVCAGYPVEVGGSPDPASKYDVQWVSTGPKIPNASATIPTETCVYNGPTRVKLNSDGTATVTSPQTTATFVATQATRPAQCYTGATNANGMVLQTVNLGSPTVVKAIFVQTDGSTPPTTPALAHSSSGWPLTGQKLGTTASTTNSVFYLGAGTAGSTTSSTTTATATDKGYATTNGDNPSTKDDGAWTPQWTSVSGGPTCNTSTLLTDARFFNCYNNPAGFSSTAYSTLKSTVQAALAANPGNYTTAAALQTYLNSLVATGNSADASGTPTFTDNRSHRWRVTVTQNAATADGCTPATGTTTGPVNTSISPPTSDPFFANSNGNSAATTSTDTLCFTATITLQIGTCNVALVAGICLNLGNYVWGNGSALLGAGLSVPQFKTTVTVKKANTTTVVTPAVSSFPDMRDVTQYAIGTGGTYGTSGPGDLYVEGTSANSLALIAQNDTFVTNTLTAANTDTNAVEVVSYNDIRVYHPVKCVSTDATAIATTDAGWCPNDITGLYSGVLPNGARPDQQYTDMRSDLANLTLHGAFFALGIPQSTVTCPQPPQGNGVCGGQFGADNYARGDSLGTPSLGTLTVIGTLAMAHHGPVGMEWEVLDRTGLTSRPYSGYQLAVKYQNLKNALASVNVLSTTSTTSSLWHVVSVSTGTG